LKVHRPVLDLFYIEVKLLIVNNSPWYLITVPLQAKGVAQLSVLKEWQAIVTAIIKGGCKMDKIAETNKC